MAIFCWGRNYPNAPLYMFTGARTRLPPHFWRLTFSGLTDELAFLNGHPQFLAPYPEPLVQVYEPAIAWAKAFSGPPQLSIGLSVEPVAGGYQLRAGISYFNAPNPAGHTSRWGTETRAFWDWGTYTGAFFPWPNQEPFWVYGGDATFALQRGDYSQLPSNSCVGA